MCFNYNVHCGDSEVGCSYTLITSFGWSPVYTFFVNKFCTFWCQSILLGVFSEQFYSLTHKLKVFCQPLSIKLRCTFHSIELFNFYQHRHSFYLCFSYNEECWRVTRVLIYVQCRSVESLLSAVCHP